MNAGFEELSICIVEPSGVQGNIIRQRLAAEGVENVQLFQAGEAALAGIRRYPPDLVISAMYLPDMTGTDLVRRLREDDDPAVRDLPFMLVSSETRLAMLEPIRQAGAVAILPKPFAPEDLRRALIATMELLHPEEGALDVPIEDLRVLIVDDSSMSRRYIRRVIENLGVEDIEEAENGRQAMERIEAGFFDLVFTDYNMPEMDGEALVRFIRERSSQRSVPVILVTSEQDSGRLSAVQQAGVSAICDKPFEPAVVRDMICRVLAD
ncbi:MAG: response regulator [Gammaproteobacteria bacterium]|nr:MAG: response regulator [Gammaproteobacteria bacterium]